MRPHPKIHLRIVQQDVFLLINLHSVANLRVYGGQCRNDNAAFALFARFTEIDLHQFERVDTAYAHAIKFIVYSINYNFGVGNKWPILLAQIVRFFFDFRYSLKAVDVLVSSS